MTTISEQLTRSFDGGAHVVDAMQYIVNQLDLATGMSGLSCGSLCQFQYVPIQKLIP